MQRLFEGGAYQLFCPRCGADSRAALIRVNTVTCPWTKLLTYLAFGCRSVWLQFVGVRQWQGQEEKSHKDERDGALHVQLNCSWLLWTNLLSATLPPKTDLWTTTTTFFYSFPSACLIKTGTSFQWSGMRKRLAALSSTWQIGCNAFNAELYIARYTSSTGTHSTQIFCFSLHWLITLDWPWSGFQIFLTNFKPYMDS